MLVLERTLTDLVEVFPSVETTVTVSLARLKHSTAILVLPFLLALTVLQKGGQAQSGYF